MDVGIADDQVRKINYSKATLSKKIFEKARDFDFIKTEMKYDSTGMFHWIPARSIEDCILVSSKTPTHETSRKVLKVAQ